jgi:outer membrane protein
MPKYFMLKHAVSASALALGIILSPLVVSAESLGDALAASYKNSGLLEQNRANLRATDEGVASAIAALRPTIGYSASSNYSFISKTWSEALTFSASMTLFTFGQNKLSIDAAKETVLATRASLVNVEQGVLSDAVDAYMTSRYVGAQVNLRQNSLRVMQSNLRGAKDRFEVGEITRTELAQFEAELASARAVLAAAEGQVASARETYKVAVGHYPSKLSAPPAVKLPAKNADEAVRIAMRTHPALKALQHQVSAYDLAVMIAERGLFPTISASASTTKANGWTTTSESLGVTASGTIYAGGDLSSAIREAMADRDAARADLHTTSREIEQGVRTAWAMLSVFNASAQATTASVEAQRVAYQGVKEEADLGASTTLDVLEAEQDLLDAQVTALQSRIDRDSSSYTLLASMGLLTVDHLNLNVPVYDPAAYYNAVKNAPTHTVSPEGAKLDRVLEALGRQ